MISDGNPAPGDDGRDPRPAAVTFVTTEHFTLQGARAATIAESTSRATMFIQGLRAGYWQGFHTVAGMIGVVTAIR